MNTDGSARPAPTKVDTLASMINVPCDILREALREVYDQMKQEEADDGK